MTIPVFVNDRCVQVAPGATAHAAALAADPSLGDLLRDGRAHLTDGRGIRLDHTSVIGAGMILRVVKSARRASEVADDSNA